jgi:hypothetical protein
MKAMWIVLFLFLLVFSCKSASPTVVPPGTADSVESPVLETHTELPLVELAPLEVPSLEIPLTENPMEETAPAKPEEFPLEETPLEELLAEEDPAFAPVAAEETELPEELPIPELQLPEEAPDLPFEDHVAPQLSPPLPVPMPVEPSAPAVVPETQVQEIPSQQIPERPRTPPLPPPLPPPFLRPAEPVIPPSASQELPRLPEPSFELPSRSIPDSATEEQIVFSRIVRVTVGQILEIPFRFTGWVYLGELGNRRGLAYSSRRLDIQTGVTLGQTFIFIAETAGTYILRFYRQDFILDYLVNDYVQVIVGERSGIERDRIVAEPRWPPMPEIQSDATVDTVRQIPETPLPGQPQPPVGIVPLTPSQTPAITGSELAEPKNLEPKNLDEYVRQARQEFDAGRIEQALTALDNMKQVYPNGTDEAWWLYGQLLEANSPSRDIRLALEYYRRLVREFPQSNRVQDAQRRITYLERYYFNIR